MSRQLNLFKCSVFGKAHHWMIDSSNHGMCKCGTERDFTEDNKKAFPSDYFHGYSRDTTMEHNLCITNGYYMQGTIRNDSGFGIHKDIDEY